MKDGGEREGERECLGLLGKALEIAIVLSLHVGLLTCFYFCICHVCERVGHVSTFGMLCDCN